VSRRRLLLGFLILGIAALALPSLADEAEEERTDPGPFAHLRVVDFEGVIAAVPAAYVQRQIEAARATGADCLVLRIDSPGGTVFHSMEIADALLEVEDEIHVVAWVPEMAYSGAAMVALACDEIVMGRAAHLGDAQPGTRGPEGEWKAAGEKLESPLRAKLRAYAQRNGYPVALAEAMVSERLEVLKVKDPTGAVHYLESEDFRQMEPEAEAFPGVLRRDLQQVGAPVVGVGELLTLTATEARDTGFLKRRFADDRVFPRDEAELLDALKADDAVVDLVRLSFSEEASRVLLELAGILSALVAISLLLLVWQGPGIMTFVGGIALVLVILINVTADQLHGFPIFLLVVGALLLAAEVFVIPGFGIAGLLGIASLGTGFLFLASGATFDDLGGLREVSVGFGLQFVATLLLGMVGLFVVSRFLPRIGPGRRMVLAAPGAPPATTSARPAPTASPGAHGRAASALRPSGKAEIDGALLDVATAGDWVPRGAEIVVVSVEGNRILVRTVEDAAGEEPA
jgi:membrane-bound serine protease (ClpP class)